MGAHRPQGSGAVPGGSRSASMRSMDERRHSEREVPADPSGIPEPHDVLAADEFGIGTRDDRYPADPAGIEDPHDVLAAEEFAMPARDERYPADPTGLQEPHDVLAAEEFAMPAGGDGATRRQGFDPRSLLPPLLAAALVLLLLRRRRRR
jgi:hypothetical protein